MGRTRRTWSEVIETILSRIVVEPESNCWVWQGAKRNGGYGNIKHRGKSIATHRTIWEYYNGPIPDGIHVLHKCDNPPCCNPDHLFLGTHTDNVRDMDNKGRRRTVCTYGEQHYKTSLTLKEAMAIKKDSRFQRLIAKDYRISESTVSHIKNGYTWKQLSCVS